MAKYNVTFSCGHNEERQLVGKEAERTRYVAWARESGVCTACKAAAKHAVLEAAEVEHELPQLTGSDKQVAWARTIRADKLRAVIAAIDAVRSRVPADKLARYEEDRAIIIHTLCGWTTARAWIDAVDTDAMKLAAQARTEAGGR